MRKSRFLVIWSVALLVILAMVSAMNTVVNPYDRFAWQRIPGVNVLKPAVKNHAALTKTYQVERARPVTAVLGTSRAYLGIDAGSAQFPDSFRPIYNYGLPGTTMGRSLRSELWQAWGTGRLRHVVAILDFPAFFAPDPPRTMMRTKGVLCFWTAARRTKIASSNVSTMRFSQFFISRHSPTA